MYEKGIGCFCDSASSSGMFGCPTAGTTVLEPAPPLSRKYTLTHNDITGNLRLTIGPEYNMKQISGFYTRLLRDEVVAEWVNVGSSGFALHVYCHVLDTLVYADRELLVAQPALAQAQVYVHFQSTVKELDTVEFWGVLGDRSTWPKGPTSILLRMIYAVVGWPPSLSAQPADLSIDLPSELRDVEAAVREQQQQQQQQQQQLLQQQESELALGWEGRWRGSEQGQGQTEGSQWGARQQQLRQSAPGEKEDEAEWTTEPPQQQQQQHGAGALLTAPGSAPGSLRALSNTALGTGSSASNKSNGTNGFGADGSFASSSSISGKEFAAPSAVVAGLDSSTGSSSGGGGDGGVVGSKPGAVASTATAAGAEADACLAPVSVVQCSGASNSAATGEGTEGVGAVGGGANGIGPSNGHHGNGSSGGGERRRGTATGCVGGGGERLGMEGACAGAHRDQDGGSVQGAGLADSVGTSAGAGGSCSTAVGAAASSTSSAAAAVGGERGGGRLIRTPIVAAAAIDGSTVVTDPASTARLASWEPGDCGDEGVAPCTGETSGCRCGMSPGPSAAAEGRNEKEGEGFGKPPGAGPRPGTSAVMDRFEDYLLQQQQQQRGSSSSSSGGVEPVLAVPPVVTSAVAPVERGLELAVARVTVMRSSSS
ncbi:hypothetical protein VOLCADRAFT_103823 [Volvox carteri f. nagariensis]|uniref:Staygreen protein domain-containing protein n=1 Tax=Volvox carteri f. nagariensis TaxID=3068 RepID=D8TPF0_VOLCA|nr:uncharacterized protein VOLCADRAFT_103823 [Volvox carteri f. nagariensis]EFJ50606.1 hypothetical protein VOLCADRAFT_103823 [Volvox carteri f. nagariensis]|eukprot:XP_002948199.1 hypothetical protein VOLCADRAFT_103823 [Volvox carteri f. nagariensis]